MRLLPGARADVLQYHHTYLRMRTDIPDLRFSRDGEIGVADGSILSYLRAEPTLVAYSPLLNGAYTRPDKQLDRAYDHPGTRPRLEALDQVVEGDGRDREPGGAGVADRRRAAGRAAHRCILIAQLDESLAAVDLQLSVEQRQLLDAAN